MKRHCTKLGLVLGAVVLLTFFLSGPLFALQVINEAEGKTPFQVPTVTSKIKLNGVLDEDAWQQALVLELKFEVDPGENIEPPVKTELLLASTTNHLYVAFRAYDPDPAKIRARFTDRDNIANDDHVGIFLDTFNDTRMAFGFLSNPNGIQADRYNLRWDIDFYEWDAIWGSAGKITKDGYIVEMEIPFSSLPFQRSKEEQVWGIDAIRYYPRTNNTLIGLFPRDRSVHCYLCQAYKVKGFKGAKPGKNIELDPTLTGHLTQERDPFPEGSMEEKDSKVDPGITARWKITPNMTLTTAVNPDFSHVEADAAQLDINTPTALFYPEKRPFFLEGASLYLGSFYVVHTRMIKDPDWGINFNTKEGKHAIGFFTAHDKTTQLIFPTKYYSSLYTLDQSNFSTAFRYRRDIGTSFVGIFVTDREGEDYFNRVAGIDGVLRFSPKDLFIFQFLGTQTEYPDQIVQDFGQPDGKMWGNAGVVFYRHRTHTFTFYGQYSFVSDNYRTDIGFHNLTGMKWAQAGCAYTWRRKPGHWFRTLNFNTDLLYSVDYQGNLLQKIVQSGLTYNGPLQSLVNVSFAMGKQTFLDVEFDITSMEFTTQFRPSGSLYLGLSGGFGNSIDYENIQQGRRVFLGPVMNSNIGRHLYLELDHVFERFEVDAGHLYTANLTNLKMVYQFNRRAFLRTILQYADYKYSLDNYIFPPIYPRFKHFFSQVLFSYKINPQTVLFLGYSDDHFGFSTVPLTQNNRTFFLKIGYALVL